MHDESSGTVEFEQMYTTSEVAKICHVKPITVREWIRTGKLQAKLVGRSYLVRKSVLMKHLEENHG